MSRHPDKTILIMAGGTGGHIFPALAVAHQLRDEGWKVLWLGNPGSMEARLVPQHGHERVGGWQDNIRNLHLSRYLSVTR